MMLCPIRRSPQHRTDGDKDVAAFLIATGADVNTKDNKGFTPLHLARVQGFNDVAALLRRHGGHE